MYLFVYGTLCKGERNHHYVKNEICISEQAFIRSKLYKGEFYYPFIVHHESEITFGELYKVDDDIEPLIDKLEGWHPDDPSPLFHKKLVQVQTPKVEVEAYTYFGSAQLNKEKEIRSGDWKVEGVINTQPVYYFAYGSCMDNARFKKAGVDHLFERIIGGAHLNHYEMLFSHHLTDGARADIGEAENGLVEGVLYEVNEEALDYLYMREGVYSYWYRPTVVTVKRNETTYRALTFTVITKNPNKAVPLHYAIEIHRGAARHLSKSYGEQIVNTFTQHLPVEGFIEYLEEWRNKGGPC
ncbi:gamma-glutamylcyclotransferase [Halobacillus sp. A5]|uniref:gamma-glutamylcyclotransferase n=1 Tax=Halobacillus sp. A5 TaxID=2880263 RepID=UPI0020A67C0E|nr:gamma-glutamylcyclotransferase family protein [Halobacillus sp. A5]MCP3025930.1 gamma-glutamylcyclotransferase [Halobacillus sp. A5]